MPQLFDFAAFKHRLTWAKGVHSGRRAPLTNDELAKQVAPLLGHLYTGAMVGKWTKDTVPTAAVIHALAIVCGVPPGWLAYGDTDTPEGYRPPDSAEEVQSRSLRGSGKPSKTRRRHRHG